MYQLNINDLTREEFLQHYWQKQPLLIKQGFSEFADPITPEELAGLATEECIESRIVNNHDNQWQAHHGPFAEFDLLSESNSTLLVQASIIGTLPRRNYSSHFVLFRTGVSMI